MNRWVFLYRIVVSAFLSVTIGAVSVTATPTSAELEAVGLVQRYVDALRENDTVTLKSLLSGRLLKLSERQLDDPEYPAYLAEIYSGARFEVTGCQTREPDTVEVDVTVHQPGQEVRRMRFVVRREASRTESGAQPYIVDELAEPK